MIRVLIADDEDKVCKLIVHLIDWETLNMELIGIATNGIAAFDMIKEQKPDLVLTDIRMPGYDGLELLKMSRQLNPNIEFIIISGYSQFEYAQTAIKYGVKDYILKPIKKEQLKTTLKEVEERYFKLYEAEKIHKIQREQIQRNEGYLREDLLRKITEEEVTEGLRVMNKKYCFHFGEGIFQVLLIRVDLKMNESMQMASLDKTLEILYSKAAVILRKLLSPLCMDAEITVLDNKIIGIMNYTEGAADDIRILLRNFMKDFNLDINIFEEIQFHLSISEADGGYECLRGKLLNAEYAMEQRLFRRNAMFLDRIPMQEEWNAEREYKKFSNQVRQSMDIQSTESIEEAIGDLKEEVAAKNVCGYQIVRIACNAYHLFLISSIFQQEYYFGNRKLMEDKFEKDILLCSNIENVFKFLKDTCVKNLKDNCSRMNMKKARPINQAKKYIKEHFSDPLTLEELGDVTGFSASYFSTVFHKETGKTFLEYLTHIRIEEAKKLLKETSKTAETISKDIGMNDYKRFSKVFRKMTGITPKEYRNLYS